MPGASHQHEVARSHRAPLRRLEVASGLVCLLALFGVPAARAAVWRQQGVPAPSGLTYPLAGSFDAVSCPTVDDCVAAGSQTLKDGQTTAAAEIWNGASWSIDSIGDPNNFTIEGVSCASATACMLVGEGISNNFAESWNGSAWSLVATPTPGNTGAGNPGNAELSVEPENVSCVAANLCVVVGTVAVGGGETAAWAAVWNGATWTPEQPPEPALPPPAPGYEQSGELNAVSCASATACTAVGDVENVGAAGDTVAFVDEWNGSTWSVGTVPPPAAAGVEYASLTGVSCATLSSCVAAGEYSTATEEGVPYSEVWNGTTWSPQMMQISPAAGQNPDPTVSCTSSTACAALLGGPGNGGGLVEEWNGASWSAQSIVSLPEPPQLSGLSCASTVSCMLVGTNNDSDTSSPLAEVRQPSGWSLAPSPLTASDRSSLDAVSCTSRSACTAVGSPSHGGVIVERWNGRDWRLQSAPSPPGAAVKAVSCASATACMLVGFQDTGMLTERWNGRTWSLDTIGSPDSVGLNAVSCTSASACIAVGGASGGGDVGNAALAERWNGRAWSSESVPRPKSDATLTGISCRSPHRCVAVGTYYTPAPSYGPDLARTLAEGWNGSRWSVQTPSQRTRLSALSCPSTTDCNAIAQQWNGRSWSLGPNPNALLNSISCVTADACTAVGSGRIEYWDGSMWKAQRAAPARVAAFNAVSCLSAQACMLVGSRRNLAGITVPLIERLA